ncbi:Cna B-type domain-containing protein [Floccifex sp.]|uniref:Cna B-type domain-containing protein n=1 Tax=Floccifex sp. TaxID=2815810 RepID=UPI003F0BD4B0
MNRIRKLLCSIACCFMVFSNTPLNIYAIEEDPTLEIEQQDPDQNQMDENQSSDSSQTKSTDAGVAAAMMAGISTFDKGRPGSDPKPSSYNHIDVRVDGTLTLTTKVNGEVLNTETIQITTSNVSGTLNGKSLSFYRKTGTGKENEWRCNNLSLNPASDVVVINCLLSGKRADGSVVSVNYSATYTESSVLNAFIQACPGHSGYDIDINAQEISESFTVNRTIQKVWDTTNNPSSSIPSSVQVQLKADNQNYGSPITLNAANGWKAELTGLPKYSSGTNEIVYTVVEFNVEGYTPTYTYNGENITITNTVQETEKRSITVSKVWDDKNDQDGLRQEVEIELYANGVATGNKLTLKKANQWTDSFTNLEKYSNGNEITYTVVENTKINGYSTEVTGNVDNGFTIKNSHTPATIEKITVKKEWKDNDDQDGIRPDSITVILKNGEKVVDQLVLNKDNDWQGAFTNLAKNENGQEIQYKIEEINMEEDYTSEIKGDFKSGFVITNTHEPEVTTIYGTKYWDDDDDRDGIRPDEVVVQLLANGKVVDSQKVSEKTQWTYSFTNVPVYEKGTEIVYSVTDDVKGYKAVMKEDYDLVNIHEPEVLDPITITKKWNDKDNKDGIRPDEITIYLLANGDKVMDLTLTEEDNWTATLEGLYKYSDGEEIEYTVKEEEVDGYTSSVDGFTITNTHKVKEETKKENPKKNNTNTGITSSLTANVSLLALSGAALIVLNKKRK